MYNVSMYSSRVLKFCGLSVSNRKWDGGLLGNLSGKWMFSSMLFYLWRESLITENYVPVHRHLWSSRGLSRCSSSAVDLLTLVLLHMYDLCAESPIGCTP